MTPRATFAAVSCRCVAEAKRYLRLQYAHAHPNRDVFYVGEDPLVIPPELESELDDAVLEGATAVHTRNGEPLDDRPTPVMERNQFVEATRDGDRPRDVFVTARTPRR